MTATQFQRIALAAYVVTGFGLAALALMSSSSLLGLTIGSYGLLLVAHITTGYRPGDLKHPRPTAIFLAWLVSDWAKLTGPFLLALGGYALVYPGSLPVLLGSAVLATGTLLCAIVVASRREIARRWWTHYAFIGIRNRTIDRQPLTWLPRSLVLLALAVIIWRHLLHEHTGFIWTLNRVLIVAVVLVQVRRLTDYLQGRPSDLRYRRHHQRQPSQQLAQGNSRTD